MNTRVTALPVLALFAALLLGGCFSINSDVEVGDGVTVERNLSTVNGAVRVGAESVVEGDAGTINGSVSIGSGSTVTGHVETVNGKISLDHGARAGSVEGVNGSIQIGPQAGIDGSVETVNGQVEVGADARVGGLVGSVNGQIRVKGGTVGSVKNAKGGIVLEQGSRVLGELRIVKSRNSFRDVPPTVEIHADCEVGGPLVFEREVMLRIHESATVGEIQGAEPEYFND